MQHDSIVYFDIAAVVIMLITVGSLLLRGLTKGAANRVYLSVMATVTFTAIVALGLEMYGMLVLSPWLNSGGEVPTGALAIPSVLAVVYYMLRSLTAPIYLMLIATISDTTHKLNVGTVVRIALWAPLVAVLFLIVTNPFHHLVFTFSGGIVVRGPCLPVLYIEAVYYSAIGIAWLLRWRALFSPDEFVTLFAMYPIMFAAIIIQYNVSGLRLEMFVTSVVLMLVSVFAMHPETRRDAQMNAESLSSYREMVKRALITGKHLCLVYVEIVNIEQLRELVGRVELQGLLRGVSDNLTHALEHDDVLYYLHNGAFCISSRNVDSEHAVGIAWQMHEQGKARALARRGEVASTPEMRTCVVRIPEDAADMETLRNFGKSFSRLVPASTVTTFKELSQREGFELQMALSSVVESAIRKRSFEVYYQPIYCLEDGCFKSAEALVRLNDPIFGWVPPSLFIPEAEQNGSIVDIGDILLDKICAFLGSVDYRATGLEYVEVNLSVDQCIRPQMASELLGLMKMHGVEPSRVNIEITETSASYSQQAVERNVVALAEAGVTISLDDFGTGYSNASRVLELPFSLVKVDKCFVDGLDNADVRAVLSNIVTTMKSIGKAVLVEGVETCGQFEAVAAMGVDYIQGYYFSHPLPQDDFLTFLKEKCAIQVDAD